MNELFADQLIPEHPVDAKAPFARYLCVNDRARAEIFYRGLFKYAAIMANERFTFFDLNGFIFGLFEPADEVERSRYCKAGHNPNLRVPVTDVKAEFTKIQALTLEIVTPLQIEERGGFFQFTDLEGNTIEFHQELNGVNFHDSRQ